MNRQEFRSRIIALDLSCDEFAAICGCSGRTVAEWGARYPVPYHARLILRLLDERGGVHGMLGRPDRKRGNPAHD